MGAFDRMGGTVTNFKAWFTERKFPSCRLRFSDLLMNSLYFALAVTLTLIVYKNIALLNEYIIIFIKTGSAALCIGAFFVLRYGYKIFKNLRYGFYGLANGYKFLIVLAILLLVFGFYHGQEQYVQKIKEKLDAINFANFNPIYFEPSKPEEQKLQSESITGRMTAESSDDSNSGSFLDSLLPASEPISEKTKDIEKKIFELTNEERKKQNERQLLWDEELAEVARDHSLDMANNDFFSHDNLGGEDPTDRARRHNYDVHKELANGWFSDGIAENIGKMPTGNVVGRGHVSNDPDSIAEAQMYGWMNSPGHRANILNDKYDRIGVGVAYDGKYYVSTQNFK